MDKCGLIADVCIVCALASEGKAAIQAFEQRAPCDAFKQDRFRFLQRSRHFYYSSIKNSMGNNLVVVISWPEREGGSAMQDLVNAMIDRFKPVLIVMTGICAGKRGSVLLGDLIIPDKTFLAESGKFLTSDFKLTQLHDGDFSCLRTELVEWVKHFDKWRDLVSSVDLPLARLCENSSEGRKGPSLHVSPMATFMAVRSDDPFHRNDPFSDWRKAARKVESLEMEGYFFYSAASQYKHVNYLIVKGVADFADIHKSDEFHSYAMTISAIYALCFIKEYVNDDDMPRAASYGRRAFCCPDGNFLYYMQSNKSYEKLPLRLSSIDQPTVDKVAPLIRDWKKIHTASEKLYYSIRYLPQIILALKQKIKDQGGSHDCKSSAVAILEGFRREFDDFSSVIGGLDPLVGGLECLSEIKNVGKCCVPLMCVINKAEDLDSVEECLDLTNLICNLIFELLSRADRFIEKGLGI